MTAQDLTFVYAFRRMQDSAAAINRRNGFTKEDDLILEFQGFLEGFGNPQIRERFLPLVDSFKNARIGLKLMLMVSELGETLEGVRKNNATAPDSHCPEFTNEEVEIADGVLRAMNYATDRNLRLAEAIAVKNAFNLDRADHQPENRAQEHGKKF